jgi:VWFA-related protein
VVIVCGLLWSSPAIPSSQTTFRSDVNLVNILATVRDGNGRIVSGLTKDDFALAEDGRPQTIHDFVAQSDLPLALGLLVDTSGSMSFALDAERGASRQFLKSALRPEGDRAFVLRFDTAVVMVSDLEDSRRQLGKAIANLAPTPRNALREPRTPGIRGRTTALYDAIFDASEHLRTVSGRKAIIVLTDGFDAGSSHSEQNAVEAALRSETSIYTILVSILPPAINSTLRQRVIDMNQFLLNKGRVVLNKLSEQTGGTSFEANDKEKFNAVYERITAELRNQYRIGLICDEQGSALGYHALSLTAKRSDLTARARRGFYFGDGWTTVSRRQSFKAPASSAESLAEVGPEAGLGGAKSIGAPVLSQARDLAMRQRNTALRFAAQERVQCIVFGVKEGRLCDAPAEILADQNTQIVRRRVEQDAGEQLRIVGATDVGEFGVEIPNIFRSLRLEEFHAVHDGAAVQKYDFVVSRGATTWQIWDGIIWLAVPYTGTIWIDPQSRQVVRLERIATKLPAELRLGLVQSVIDFAPADLGGDKTAMLPTHIEERICERDNEVCERISSSIQGYSKYESLGTARSESTAPPGPDKN